MKYLLVAATVMAVACLTLADPFDPPKGYPQSYLAQTSSIDPRMHIGYAQKMVIAASEEIGFYVHLPGQMKIICMNTTVGQYLCFTVSYGSDPVDCQVSEEDAVDIYELGVIARPGDNMIYMRDDVVGGQVCEVWYDPSSKTIWTYTRDVPRVPIKVQYRDLSQADYLIDTLEEADVSGMINPPPYGCVPSSVHVKQAFTRIQDQLMGLKSVEQEHQELLMKPEVADAINNNQDMYTAGIYELFTGMTIAEFKETLGVIPSVAHMDVYRPTRGEHAINDALPENFDARDNWPGMIHPIWNQASCGSCWAHGTSKSFGDRLAIATNGNYTDGASRSIYIRDNGIPSEKCLPTYHSAEGLVPECPAKCEDGSDYELHYAVDAFHVVDEEDIKYELVHYGPLRADFDVYLDFPFYKGGIYKHNESSQYLGGHAVTLIGYGVLDGVKYWLLQNSWGPEWGVNGTFMILRGQHECNIDDFITGNHAPRSSQDNACNYDICQNNAKCIRGVNHEITCECPPAFGGVYCGTWVDPCASNPCNGQVCNSTYGSAEFNCVCSPPVGGDYCEKFSCGGYVAKNGYSIVSCSGSLDGDGCHLECGRGYAGKPDDVMCSLSGWSNATGCSLLTCGTDIVSQVDGYHTRTCTGHSYGDSCSLSCASGFTGEGGDVVCMGNGKWSKPAGCAAKLDAWEWFGVVTGTGVLAFGVAFIGFFFGGRRAKMRSSYEPILDNTNRRTSINQ